MSMSYIRMSYQVPAKRGAKVIYYGASPHVAGTITGSTLSGHIRVRFDGAKRSVKLHPTWCIEYLAGDSLHG